MRLKRLQDHMLQQPALPPAPSRGPRQGPPPGHQAATLHSTTVGNDGTIRRPAWMGPEAGPSSNESSPTHSNGNNDGGSSRQHPHAADHRQQQQQVLPSPRDAHGVLARPLSPYGGGGGGTAYPSWAMPSSTAANGRFAAAGNGAAMLRRPVDDDELSVHSFSSTSSHQQHQQHHQAKDRAGGMPRARLAGAPVAADWQLPMLSPSRAAAPPGAGYSMAMQPLLYPTNANVRQNGRAPGAADRPAGGAGTVQLPQLNMGRQRR